MSRETAARNYAKFHGRPHTKAKTIDFTPPKALTFLGECVAIEYASTKKMHSKDKTVKKRLYRHEMGKGVKIYLHPNRRIVFVMGGKFRVTDWMRD